MANIKGTGMLPIVKTLRTNKEMAREVLPDRLHPYLEDRIIASGWYPEADFVEILRAAARMFSLSSDEFYEIAGRSSAIEDLNGVYHEFLRTGDPLGMLRAGVLAWQSYHDTGRIIVTPEGPGAARVDLVGYEMLCDEMCAVNTAWIKEELRLAGALDIEVTMSRCVCRGDAMCRWQTRWR